MTPSKFQSRDLESWVKVGIGVGGVGGGGGGGGETSVFILKKQTSRSQLAESFGYISALQIQTIPFQRQLQY